MSGITAFAKGCFDPEEFNRSEYGMNAFQMQYIYKQYMDAPMHPTVMQYWHSMGAKKQMFSLSKEEDRVYTVFTPLEYEEDRKYPLIYCFHDREDDIFLAETYGYTELVEQQKLICVYPEYRVDGLEELDTEFRKIISDLKDKGCPIDEERIYVTGFYYGASAAMKLSMICPGIFAGIGLFCGAHVFRGSILPRRIEEYGKYGYRQPFICIGGSMDINNAWPLEKEDYRNTLYLWMKKAAHLTVDKVMSDLETDRICRDSDDKVKREFGLDFHRTQIEYMERTYWYHGIFQDDEKIPMMEFYNVEGLPHIHCKMVADRIWNYLRHFRIEKGTGRCIYLAEQENMQGD